MLLGIAGAEVGGLIGRALWGSSGVTGWGLGSWLLAIGGSLLLLFLYRLITSRRGVTSTTTKTGGRWAAWRKIVTIATTARIVDCKDLKRKPPIASCGNFVELEKTSGPCHSERQARS